jgi:hypothetical protein
MSLQIKPESTPTRVTHDPSTPQSTHPGEEANRVWPHPERIVGLGWTMEVSVPPSPPEDAVLDVVITFGNDVVRMEAVDIGVSTEGSEAPNVYARLIDAVSEYLEASKDERAELLNYSPDTWFRFVPPNQARPKTLTERFNEAYDEDTSTVKAAPTDGFINELSTLYEFKDGPVVESFLEENPSLGGLLFDANKIISEHFGPEVEMALEVVADPEALGDKQLFVLIRTEFPRKDARARLAQLDQAWWLYALPAAEGKMEIALE